MITRNGKITAEEAHTIAEAAQLYGSGEVTMTSRLTMEIQGVPYDNIEPLREYLMQAGLEMEEPAQKSSGCIVQGNDLSVRADRYVCIVRRNS